MIAYPTPGPGKKIRKLYFAVNRSRTMPLLSLGLALSLLSMACSLLASPTLTPVLNSTATSLPQRTSTSQPAQPNTATAASPTRTPNFSDTPRPSHTSTATLHPTDTFLPTSMPSTMTHTATLSIGSTMTSDKDGMTLVYVPAGKFLMGSMEADIAQALKDCGSDCSNDAFNDEKPQHTVYLDAYWIDRTDVTNAMYAQCVRAGNCQPPTDISSETRGSYYGDSAFDNYPVIHVSWNDAKAYCEWAGRRLPTEAEWEKAARGIDGWKYPWGNQAPDQTRANFNSSDTTEVGHYLAGASPYGALDMAGNVWQWVADWYSVNYYASSPRQNPTGPASGTCRVLRGGAWYVEAQNVRVASRLCPDKRDYGVGFRCSH